jgi:uncharacterized membrane protein
MQDETSIPDEGVPPAEEGPTPEAPDVVLPPHSPNVTPTEPEMSATGEAVEPAPPPPPEPAPPPVAPPVYGTPPPPPPPYAPPVEVMPQRPGPASDSSKALAALGYIFVVIAIVMLFVDPYKDEKFVKFHAVQAIALWIVETVAWVLLVIPVLGWIAYPIVSVLLLVAAIIALVKAFQGEYYEVPGIYGFIRNYVGE